MNDDSKSKWCIFSENKDKREGAECLEWMLRLPIILSNKTNSLKAGHCSVDVNVQISFDVLLLFIHPNETTLIFCAHL